MSNKETSLDNGEVEKQGVHLAVVPPQAPVSSTKPVQTSLLSDDEAKQLKYSSSKSLDTTSLDPRSSATATTSASRKQRPLSDGPIYCTSKIYSILGTDVAPEKARQILGDMDPKAVLRAREQDLKELIAQRQEILQRKPNSQQTSIPRGTPIPVSTKALDIFGSDDLKQKSMKAIPNEDKNKSNKKLLQTFGALELADDKAQKILGSNDETEDVSKAVKLANETMERERVQLSKEQMRKILKQKPDAEQLAIPLSPKGKGTTDRVASKALHIFGDENLETASREVVIDAQVKQNRKVVKVFGDEKLFPKKAASTIGTIEQDTKARKLADEALEQESLKLKQSLHKQQTKAVKAVLKQPTQTQQLRLPSQVRLVPDKALDIMGEESLAQQVRERIPKDVVIKPKAISVLGESRIAGKPVACKLGSSENDTQAVRKANQALIDERSAMKH